jgi:hypothetical protein
MIVGVAPAGGIADVICWVAAIVVPLVAGVRTGGGGAGGTRGGGELGGRCGSVICYFSTKCRAIKAIDGLETRPVQWCCSDGD